MSQPPDTSRRSPDDIGPLMPLTEALAPPLHDVRALARRVQDLTSILGVLAIVTAFAQLERRKSLPAGFEGSGAGGISQRLADMATPLAFAVGFGLVIDYVMTMILMKRLTDNGRVLAPQLARYSSHWAVTGWILPIISLFRPYQIVRQIWYTSHYPVATNGADQDFGRSLPMIVRVWWVAFLVMSSWRSISVIALRGGHVPNTTANQFLLAAIGNCVVAGAAILFVLTLSALTRKHEEAVDNFEKVTAPPTEFCTSDSVMV